MKKSFLILSLAVIILGSGCRKIILKWYGVKQPDYETTQSIEKFKSELFGEEIPYLTAKYDMWKSGKLLSMPDVFVFNKDGLYIPYKDSLRPNCNGPAELFLSELNTQKEYHFSPEFTLKEFLTKFDSPGCIDGPVFPDEQKDFYIFFTWANWSGKKLFREKTVEWIKALHSNKNISYKIILVNMDLQDCWTVEQKASLEAKK